MLPPGDEGDELTDTLLHALPGLLGHLARMGHHLLHHLRDVVDREEFILMQGKGLQKTQTWPQNNLGDVVDG